MIYVKDQVSLSLVFIMTLDNVMMNCVHCTETRNKLSIDAGAVHLISDNREFTEECLIVIWKSTRKFYRIPKIAENHF